MATPERSPYVLVVDDDPDDRLLIQEAFEERCIRCRLCFMQDGVELMEHLRASMGWSKTTENRCPDLILLDLNMPRKDGRQTLEEIKSDPDFRSIPTVVLTTSQNEDDIATCYKLGANAYIVKPTRYSDLLGVADTLRKYWIETAAQPIKHERHDKK